MVDAAAAAAPGAGASSVGAAALKVAQTQLGVHEQGVNTGERGRRVPRGSEGRPRQPVVRELRDVVARAGRATRWTAAAGPRSQTWVRNAEAGKNNLEIVSADQARPGDIVAYDWGHQDDFGSDGHIGFLASNVEDGKFTALEGNNQDQVMKVPRDVDMANVKFIRVDGDAPPASAAGRAPAPAAVPTRRRPAAARGVADAAAAAAGGGGANPYPGDDAPKEQIAAWMAARPRSAACPSSCRSWPRSSSPGVKNLNFGDADSVGFFQMRVGIWNKGEYAGFPDKPELQVKWFLDQAEAVKKQRDRRGQVGRRPEPVRRLDRRRRAPGRAVPRPLPAPPRRGARPAGQAGDAPPAAPAAAAAAPAPGAPVGRRRRRAARAEARRVRPVHGRGRGRRGDAKKGGPACSWPSSRPPGRRARWRARGGAGHGRRRRRGGARLAASSTLGASALKVAQTQLGVHEAGANTGAEVDEYLAAAERRRPATRGARAS